jgi:hypothetical protein
MRSRHGPNDRVWLAGMRGLVLGMRIAHSLGTERSTIVRERSKDMHIVLDESEATAKIDAIVAVYKQLFHQQSVGVIVRAACVAF